MGAVFGLGLLLLLAAGAGGKKPRATSRRGWEASTALKAYLLGGGNWGWKGSRSPQVAAAQRILGITTDGIVGPDTRRATLRYGVRLPPPEERRVS